jgi:hypothetical protein
MFTGLDKMLNYDMRKGLNNYTKMYAYVVAGKHI